LLTSEFSFLTAVKRTKSVGLTEGTEKREMGQQTTAANTVVEGILTLNGTSVNECFSWRKAA
jgi:hypothetical protein